MRPSESDAPSTSQPLWNVCCLASLPSGFTDHRFMSRLSGPTQYTRPSPRRRARAPAIAARVADVGFLSREHERAAIERALGGLRERDRAPRAARGLDGEELTRGQPGARSDER